jgi:alkylated DNA repair protein alkB family protein 7
VHAPYLDFSRAPGRSEADFPVVLLPNFITQAEMEALAAETTKEMNRRRYEQSHWDSVIRKYRELQKPLRDLAPGSVLQCVAGRVHALFAQMEPRYLMPVRGPRHRPFASVHVLDLAADGRIDSHVDSVLFSGDVVCGVSLLSGCVMELDEKEPAELERGSLTACDIERRQGTGSAAERQREAEREARRRRIRMYLPPGSLYVLLGESRYKWGHAVLPDVTDWAPLAAPVSETARPSEAAEAGALYPACDYRVDRLPAAAVAAFPPVPAAVTRGRRISLMFRDEKVEEAGDTQAAEAGAGDEEACSGSTGPAMAMGMGMPFGKWMPLGLEEEGDAGEAGAMPADVKPGPLQ